MRVGIIQSCYIPWRGYFDFIKSVDLFLLFDDVQYPRGRNWRNRNQVKTEAGLKWLTVPVPGKAYTQRIDEVRIAETDKPWRDAHRSTLRSAFKNAPFGSEAISLWEEAIAAGDVMLSDLNARLLRAMCSYLSIHTPLVPSRRYKAEGTRTERLINLLKAVGATTYLSGPAAKDYLDEDAFRRAKLRLEYKTYDYTPYPQLWGAFEGTVTVLDLIANCGPESKTHITSGSPSEIAGAA